MTDDIDISVVDRLVADIGTGPEVVIPILRGIQDHFNYLPEPALRRICEITDITPASVTGVSTFYAQFRHTPAGQHAINVCIGTACHVKGAETVYHAFRNYLGIQEGEDTDSERLFTVQKVACLGCCMLAPAVRIDDVTYGYLDVQRVPHVIHDFLESRRQTAQETGDEAGRTGADLGEIRLCTCSSCEAAGAQVVFDAFRSQARKLGLAVTTKSVGCTGISYEAPFAEVVCSDGRSFRYGRISPEDVPAILTRHFRPAKASQRGRLRIARMLERLYTDEAWEPVTRYAVDLRDGPSAAYWGCQEHVVTEHPGAMDPLDIDEYIRNGGFETLKHCVTEMAADTIIDTIEQSGLRGRGGGGFPTGRKWRTVHLADADKKYLVCNGDEGDPGAFMDRMILESFPYRVIEGVAIAAVALNVSEAFLYIRTEYPLALGRVTAALDMCRQRGILGESVMGSEHALELHVMEGAGAFVCGEETALLAAIEGRRGMPQFRPPFPAEKGLWGKPTLINNVETFATVPWVIRNGVEAFAKLGTGSSPGTKSFALAGKVVHGGLIEVPMGMTLRQIVDDIGGGIQDGRTLKAVQVGGPSGGCVPATLCDTAVDYEALTSAGAIMGSGGMVVLDDTDCMVDVARYFMAFTQHESCGKCTFCRVGTKRMLEILERLCSGEGEASDIEALESLAELVQNGSLCGLGRTAPNPVLSTLKHFRSEYEAHVAGHCPAGKCKALIRYTVTDDCIGCTKCAQNCPVNAIPMAPYKKHVIDTETCIRCDTCRKVCPVDAIVIET